MTFWKQKRVFITGHTGFKGSWLCYWLALKGAVVGGYALEPNTNPNLFELLNIKNLIKQNQFGDINNLESLKKSIHQFKPEIVFHLAAQPLVRLSYAQPLDTLKTNILGTAHVLEALRDLPSVQAIVVITTDKVYENLEWDWPYRENDHLGGHDVYSASKACAEIVTQSYRRCFFKKGAGLASVRAGNVIGGGDWSLDRLVPDMIRAIDARTQFQLRSPDSIRPWQHVLEPLYGYMKIAERLYLKDKNAEQAFNLGPHEADCISVGKMVQIFKKHFLDQLQIQQITYAQAPHEAQILKLDCSRAKNVLGLTPRLKIEDAIQITSIWYDHWIKKLDLTKITQQQIEEYERLYDNT